MTDKAVSSLATGCPVCGSADLDEFVELLAVPVYCNVLWSTREQAEDAARGDMRLAFCRDCTHIYNTSFDPGLVTYAEDYENSLLFSPRFRTYADRQAKHLVEKFSLHDKLVVEIGCGKGDFLKLLCDTGGNRAVGFDPSLDGPAGNRTVSGPVTLIQGIYSEAHADLAADLICCRQVLEHLSVPHDLLSTVRKNVAKRPKTAIFFEMPNALFTLRDMGIWDLIYEHVSYFTPTSLGRAFAVSGFEVEDLREDFEGQYLCVEAFASPGQIEDVRGEPDSDHVADLVVDFAEEYRNRVDSWSRRLGELADAGRRAAIWGAGSKGVSFLNAVQNADAVSCVVDISPRKHGMHVAGTGQKVVPPEALLEAKPDLVIVMNPIYRDEIADSAKKLGLEAEFVAV